MAVVLCSSIVVVTASEVFVVRVSVIPAVEVSKIVEVIGLVNVEDSSVITELGFSPFAVAEVDNAPEFSVVVSATSLTDIPLPIGLEVLLTLTVEVVDSVGVVLVVIDLLLVEVVKNDGVFVTSVVAIVAGAADVILMETFSVVLELGVVIGLAGISF